MNNCKIIFDPIHGPQELPLICIQIINTIEFYRLRNIYQLGACYYVFPGASHKRFEHSIGVCYLAGELIKNLQKNQPELNIDNEMVENIQIAGLCHDLGHGPFSHCWDNHFLPLHINKLNKNREHENRSCIIFEHIIKKYNLDINTKRVRIIKELIYPKNKQYKNDWYYEIVANCSNGIDVDKFDYIARDTINIGLSYSFCYQRLLKLARVIDNHICYPKKTIFEINNLFQTRYRLHCEIYNHPVVKSIEFMIIDILSLCEHKLNLSQKINSIEEFIKLDDNIFTIIENIEPENDSKIIKAQEILKNIKLRKLYKYIGEININKQISIQDFGDIKKIILQKHNDYDFQNIKEDDVIIENLNLSYNYNPIDHVNFYENDILEVCNINKLDYINQIKPIQVKKNKNIQ